MYVVGRVCDFIVRIELIILLGITPILFFPSANRILLLLIIPFLWICRKVSKGSFIDRTPFNWGFLILGLTLLVSLYATYSIEQSLPKLVGMFLGISIFFAIVSFSATTKTWNLAATGLLSAGLLIALLGLLGTRWLHKVRIFDTILSTLPTRLTGLQGAEGGFHPNQVAGALLWVLPFALSFGVVSIGVLVDKNKRQEKTWTILIRILALLAGIVMLAVFILTQSRGGYLAFGITISIMLIITVFRQQRWVAFVAIMMIIFAGSVVGYLVLNTGPPDNSETTQFVQYNVFSLDSLEGRIELWSRAIYGIQDFTITGMGMNTFREVVHVLYPLFTIRPDLDIGHAHNNFLQAALDLGVFGLIAYLSIHITAFCILIKVWRYRKKLPFSEGYSQTIILGLGGGLLAHQIYGLTDAIALGAKPGILLWWMLGLIAALYRLQEEQEEQVTGRTGNRKDR